MNPNRFVGIAYWSVDTNVSTYLQKAYEVLLPLQDAALAQVEYKAVPAGEQLEVSFEEEKLLLILFEGKGRGAVHCSPYATAFVVCLIALRKHIGDISVVTDSQEDVPTTPRQNHPLFVDDWLRVLPVAQELGLVKSGAFAARHAGIFNNLF